MARIGIMGGTFNPIHNGHLHIANAAYKEYGLDEIWFIPNHIAAYKSKADLVSSDDRIEMVKLAIANHPEYKLNTMEIDRGGKTYTVDTMRILHEKLPENQYYFIVGADSLESFPKWYCARQILNYTQILVAARADVNINVLQSMITEVENQLGVTNCFYIIHDITAISNDYTAWIASSTIRSCIFNNLDIEPSSGQPLEKILPQAVFKYIKDRQLYA